MIMMSSDTITAPATPRGISAIAIIRVSGPMSFKIFSEIISNKSPTPNQVQFCRYISLRNHFIDETLAVFFKGPKSFTGEDSMEIYCHGNMLIVEKILQDLCERGCRIAEPGEFTKRALMKRLTSAKQKQ